ncbi:phospholipase A2 inhibitor and Ly6/PLAUR domain-containing protein-like [Micropterus dolomieu]|uniref:phospholipase A2 inhibitor and Ly6/PLAUR domain-containing protein-like n=1 Tax=Micropterus dolomieu TaxID=147949 RepID=UPI001E8CF8CB|nr:phospholipase A2 inhibitor and Ly6/PLAUR domain-containing protein-like [Micropterus dolomieu]
MKLILSLTLIWALSSTAGALQCLSCTNDQCANPPSLTCSSETMCATATFQTNSSGVTVSQIVKACAPSSVCAATGSQKFSFNVGVLQTVASLQCCNTDNCNTETLAIPSAQPNSLKCFTCNATTSQCNSQLQCQGVEDRCVKFNVTNGATNSSVFGCASANLCTLNAKQSFLPSLQSVGNITSGPSCCGTSLCNAVTTIASDAGCMSLLLGVLIFTLRFF